MNNSINIHDRIQEMMTYKFKGKQKFPYPQSIPKIKLKKVRQKTLKPLGFSDQNRRNIADQLNNHSSNRLSQQFASELLNRASILIEEREYNMKNIRLSETSPEHIESEKRLIDSLISKFDESKQNILLAESRKKLHSKLETVSSRPKQDPKIIDLVKLPIIANAKNLNIMQRKRALHKWGQSEFKYNNQQTLTYNDQITSFIKEVDKQKLQHQNFKIRVNKQINRIEYLRDESFHQKYLGELLEMKSSYKFHDIFMRYRKVKNHLNIQEL